jgi:hypothetical protein
MGLPLTTGAATTSVGVAKAAGVWPAMEVRLGEQATNKSAPTVSVMTNQR